MNLKIVVAPWEIGGTNRGGEDLYVIISATADAKPTEKALAGVFEQAFKDVEIDSQFEVTKKGCIQYSTSSYGFEVKWTRAALKERVWKELRTGDWVRHVKTGKYTLRVEIYIDGNAD